MISECIMWVGIYTSTYQDEIDEWYHRGDETDKEVLHCSDVWMDDDNEMFVDSGGLFDGKVVLFMGAEEWKSGETQWVLNKYKQMEGDVRLALVYQGGDPAGKVKEYATEEIRERRIPFDPDDQAEWTQKWLADRNVTLRLSDARAVAEHVGYDIGKLVEALTMISSGAEGQKVTRSEVIDLLGPLGETEQQDLMNAILAGDRGAASESLQRLEHFGHHYLFTILSRKMRAYCAIAYDANVDLEVLGFYGGQQHYVHKEARGLKKQHAIRILGEIAEAESRLKGGGEGLSGSDSFLIFVDNLASIYKSSKR